MKRLIGWALAVVLALTGCAATPAQSEPSEPVAPKAAYLAPKEGALLASDDLVAHPEVAVVHDMGTLKTTDAPQVWIDKACLDIADREWLLSLNGVPIVVVGHGDGLYAFAERLDFPVEMPAGASGDPDKEGFCVWLQRVDGASMRGFTELTVDAILDACGQMTAS
jgi:hypothetical protein